MALTDKSEVDAALALLKVEPALRQKFDKIIIALERRGLAPAVPCPVLADWLAYKPDPNAHCLANTLIDIKVRQSPPSWAERIRTLHPGR